MGARLKGRHFITTAEFERDELEMMIEVSYELKRKFALGEPHRLLPDKTVFMLFFDESTRTRNSIEAGITQLGGHAHFLTPDKTQIAHGESPKDTAIVLSRFGHSIAIRHCQFGVGNKYIRNIAKHATVPVINMQDDVYHPLQVMADLMTIQEKLGKDTRGLKIVVSWTYAESHLKPLSVPQSQILLFPRFGMDVTLAYPEGFDLMPDIVEQAKKYAELHNTKFEIVHDMDEAFKDADVIIAKNWGGFYVGETEEEIRAKQAQHKDWICNRKRMELAKRHAIYMHALPADRNKEVTDEVLDGPWSVIYDEAENRLHTAKAIMALLMGGI
ncbi:MAG: ornithine carbamoyltransferase [Thermotogae bacterium]|nr:MAG: ornithine carbamoyltransferase [Thermotogota bacterium]